MTTTASHLMAPLADPLSNRHYQHAMGGLQKELRKPGIQQRVFTYAKASPTELVRSKLSTSEIQHRALTYLPPELLANIPENENAYSLFQGFQASLPEGESRHRKEHRRHGSHGPKLLRQDGDDAEEGPTIMKMRNDRDALHHKLELMGVRKNMCSAEIREIDNKIANLNSMRKIVLDRLADLEQDELQVEQDLLQVDSKLEDLMEELEDAATLGQTPTSLTEVDVENEDGESSMQEANSDFMSASIYEKIPPSRTRRHRSIRRKSMPIRHEHFEPGSNIREIQAHNDMITALDFDAPFGTMVTSALDDTVRVWDLNLGRCMGLLEGHHASVRCLQVEDNIVATGSMDASIRLWDLSKAQYAPQENMANQDGENEVDDGLGYDNPEDLPPPPHPSSMQDCPIFSLEAHVDEVTALHFRGDTLVSGSADKTLRQWDLVKGRCVQTLDVLWAAAQASTTMNSSNNSWRTTGRLPDASADFVGALQCFDAALACGTADGMVRLWDLRSGQVHRSLVGHTAPVTCLQFDDVHLVTGSLDRSIRASRSLE
jgi:division protein 1